MRIRLIIFLAVSALLAGCAASRQQMFPSDPAVLRVGTTPNAPPMIFRQAGQTVGVEAELAEALGRDLGRRVVFVERDWDELISALVNDEVDIVMSGMSVTAGRRAQIAFANPYLKIGQMALVRSDEQYKYVLNFEGIAERGIGVEQGTTAEQMVRQQFPRTPVKYYPSGEKAAEALVKKNIDLYFSDAPMIWYLSGQFAAEGLVVAPVLYSEEYLAWGVRRTDPQLLESVNAFLQRMQQNGELDTILQRWVPGYRAN